MTETTAIANLVDRGMEVEVRGEDYTLLGGPGPMFDDRVYVRFDHEEGEVVLEVVPGDPDKVPLVIKFSKWDNAILGIIELWVG